MKGKIFFLSILFFLICVILPAQTGNGFSPVVSQIKAESRNNFIRLTWIDSPDARGRVYIFRSTRPFGDSIPANIRPVTVRYGEQYFIDDTDDMENLYYFIAASDSTGRRFDVIIPNTNTIGINIAKGEVTTPPVVVQEKEVIQGISNLRARQEEGRVIITFDVTGKQKNTILYRSMQPIRQPRDLLNAAIVKSGVSSPFTDFPVPGISWYYALAFEDEVTSGSMILKPGVNTIASAVTISAGQTAEKAIRPIPLPIMTLSNTASISGPFLNDSNADSGRVPLSEKTEKMLSDSGLPEKAVHEKRSPRVFTEDLQMPSSGSDSALFQIINEYFVAGNWEGARTALLNYLSLSRSKDVEARARFYLGQALYFTGNYRGALFEFLSISSAHPAEANSWIDTVLSAMVD